MSWSSTIMFCKIILISVLVQQNLGFDIYDGEKRQVGMMPYGRVSRPGYWAFVEDKKQGGGLVPNPRIGRKIYELKQTLIPYPRAGRTLLDPENYDYDLILSPDYILAGVDDLWMDSLLDTKPTVQKRGALKLIPRIGRKKRSITDEQNEHEEDNSRQNGDLNLKSDSNKPVWEDLEDFDNEYFFRPDRQVSRSRNSFVPRVGKKSFEENFRELSDKRAMLTPRIGRASLIPRIGRNDPRFKVKSRGAFIPRVGRRAALIPRIGRRSDKHMDKDDSE